VNQTVVVQTPSSVVVQSATAQAVVAQVSKTVVVQDTKPRTVVVTRGIPGPRGKQGIPGPAGGATLVPVGPEPISGHSAVAVDADGLLVPADCTLPAHLGAVLGVVVNAYSPGDDAVVQTSFPLEHVGWTWSPGPVYVGAAGQLTQALPAGALFSQLVGVALSATRVLIDLQPPITIT
jgi:hypothetical protein